MLNASKETKLTRVSNAVAAGTTDNLSGRSPRPIADAWSDLEGSAITVADDDDNQLFACDVVRPQKRYVRAVVDRGTANATVDGIIAQQYGPKAIPTTQPATTTVETNISPDEGTA